MTTELAPDGRGGYRLEGDVTASAMTELSTLGHVPRLSITGSRVITVEKARRLARANSIEWLWLWCEVTRRAMRHVIRMPRLACLDVFALRGPGALEGFGKAASLRTLRIALPVSEADLLAIAECASLEELGTQGSALTRRAIAALLALPNLRSLDIEATRFDDRMAKQLSASTTLVSLDVGATRITGKGLAALARMPQLRSLDLWATRIAEPDLELLRGLPQLQHVSLGSAGGSPPFDLDRVVPLLLSLPNLKRVWLDGIHAQPQHIAALQARLESVRYTT
jgi:hypothetical protein